MHAVGLRIKTFGGLRTYLGEVPVPGFGARSAEALLVYLARNALPVPRELLAELLWPEHDTEQAQTNLRTALHRLRRVIGADLVANRWTAGLSESVWSDAGEFETDLRHGHLAEALDLYTGDFLAGFHLASNTAFEAWVADEQEQWRQRALAVCQEVLNLAVTEDRLEDVLTLSRRLVTIDPLHEPGQRSLISTLARLGRRGAALEQYRVFVERLAAEIGVDPDPATVSLGVSLYDESVEHNVDTSPSRTGWRRLPRYGIPLMCREVELERLARILADPGYRFVTVIGQGGVGKTHLAVEAAAAYERQGPGNRVCFVPLAGLRSADLIFPAVARELDPGWPPADLERQLFAYLRTHPLLLLLDNFENVLDGADRVATLLREAPAVKVLVTSRERLRLPEELLVTVEGLATGGAAHRLFEVLATRIDPYFDPADHRASITTICEAVEGLPLALELATAWLGTLNCEQIADWFPTQALSLVRSSVTVPERHHSLRGAFDHSWKLLSPDLADVYSRLSVFRGGCAPDEARHVAGASAEQLAALMDKSLLRQVGDGRFELHELLRLYSAERLAASGRSRAGYLRHFEAYSSLAEEGAAQIRGAGITTAVARLAREQDNFDAALNWALSVQHDPDAIAKLVCDLAWYWRVKGPLDVSMSWLERSLDLEGLSQVARAWVGVRRMQVTWMVLDFEAVDELAPDTMDAFEKLGRAGLAGLGAANVALAMTRLSQGRAAEARERALSAIDQLSETQDLWNLALAFGLLGRAEAAEGRPEAALAALAQSLARFGSLGNQWGMGLFIGIAGSVNLELGNLETARRQAEQGIGLLHAVGFRHALGSAYERLALVTHRMGEEDLAEEYVRRGREIDTEFGWGV